VASRELSVTLSGSLDIDTIQALVPPNLPALQPLLGMSGEGQISLATVVAYGPEQGLSLSDAKTRA
jgi:hypothetical protein